MMSIRASQKSLVEHRRRVKNLMARENMIRMAWNDFRTAEHAFITSPTDHRQHVLNLRRQRLDRLLPPIR